MMPDPLPRCAHTGLARIHCDHCDGFEMSAAERAHLATVTRWGEPPALPAPARDTRPGRPVTSPPTATYADPAPPRRATGQGQPCQICDAPAGHGYLCHTCTDQTERDLGDVPALIEDLTIHATGQSRFVGGAAGDGLPFAQHAARLLREGHAELSTAIRALTEARGLPLPAIPDTPAAMSTWLLGKSRTLALDPAGPDIARGLRRWHTASMRAIDTPPERRYIGLCRAQTSSGECGTALHVTDGTDTYQCPRCGTWHDVDRMTAELSSRIRSVTATVAELVTLAEHEGYRVSRRAIEGYIERGRLHRVGRRRPRRYSVGALFELLDEKRRAS